MVVKRRVKPCAGLRGGGQSAAIPKARQSQNGGCGTDWGGLTGHHS